VAASAVNDCRDVLARPAAFLSEGSETLKMLAGPDAFPHVAVGLKYAPINQPKSVWNRSLRQARTT
jgi:hypothetical protein